MDLQRKPMARYLGSLTDEERDEVAQIDAEMLELVRKRRELTMRRQLITNRACQRARVQERRR